MSKFFKRFAEITNKQGWYTTIGKFILMIVYVLPLHTLGVGLERLAQHLADFGFWLQLVSLKPVDKHPNDL